MAGENVDAARGFVPVRNQNGTEPTISHYVAKDSTIVGAGALLAYDLTDETVSPFVGDGTDDAALVGVAVHGIAAATSDRTIAVYSDPYQEYEVQADDTSIADLGDIIGLFFPITNSAAETLIGSRYVSTAEINAGSGVIAYAATTVVQGIRLGRTPPNVFGEWATVVVRIAHQAHLFGGGALDAA